MKIARESDINSIIDIWTSCFPEDSAGYVSFFLRSCFFCDTCLLWEDGPHPAAMLHLLPMALKYTGREYSARYVYAAATLPQYRGRGIMAGLLDYAYKICEKSGTDFLVLLPQSESLYSYYERSGYRGCFAAKRVQYTRRELEELSLGAEPACFSEPDFKRIAEIRGKLCGDAVLWSLEMEEYPAREWIFSGGEILYNGRGFAFCRKEGNALAVGEFCFPHELCAGAVRGLLKRYGCDNYVFYTPVNNSFFERSVTVKRGMINPVGEKNAEISQDIIGHNVYLNMALE